MAYEDDIALRDRFLDLWDQVRYRNVPPSLAIQARRAWEATDTFKKEQQAIQEKTDAISSLKSQVLDQWKQLGVPSIGGGLSIDERAQGLAERLYANQITDLAKLGLGTGTQLESAGYVGDFEVQKEVPASYLTYDGRQIGFLGDIGTAQNWQPTGYLQQGNLASWGAQGEGAVGYTVQKAPNGQVYFIPSWGSTSDVSTIAPIAAIGLGLLAPGIGNAIGAALAPAASAAVQAAIGSAVIGGTMAEASGGDFLTGALTGAAGSALSPVTSAISETVGSEAIGRALTSGAMAEATGGDFTQAALTGALIGAINEAKLAVAEDYINSIAPGTSYEADLPTSQDVLNVIAAEQPSYQISDTTFTPDYSLSTGAPVIPEMGAQGIQGPTINEVIDILDGVDYSIPIPDSGIGLVMPTAPNLESMGGAQGVTIPVSGGTLTEVGVIPETYIPVLGDETSFINQPVPEVSVNIPEIVEQPKDISGELAAAEDYINSIAPSQTYESDLPTLNVVPGDTIDIFDTPITVDSSFTPDYSLSSVASVIPEMGAQGIQVPTINEVVETIGQPVDYSLPVQSSGIGLQLPVIENLPELGGAQGITIPVVNAPEFVAPDTSFTPDYSLNVGSPVIPEMGAQGIQVPTINEVIDVVNQPVDYSLPAPSSGLGLVMPSAPTLESMGGGQGITVPVSGGTLTETGVIPVNYVPVLGDEQSFINQPAPNVEIVIPEPPEPQQEQPTEPKDISSNLAILDVVKALVPTLVTTALAEQVQNRQEEPAQTGFPILPVPSDWRSPEYNMAFTPSAPIDFGTRELLRGTQWENPQIQAPKQYSISDVINALNYQSVPFVQQNYQIPQAQMVVPDILEQFNVKPTVGVNDIIGNLGNRPVSIADIIYGIQSGQNYSS